VRIAATDDIAAHVIAPHLSEFRAFHPDIELEIVAQMDVLNLTRREADIAVRSAKPESGDLIARRIGSWGYGLYASRSYVEAHRRSLITPQALNAIASQARRRIRTESGGYRRDYLRPLAQRIEVDAKEVRIMEWNSVLLRALVAASSGKMAGLECPVSHESGAPRPMKMGNIRSPWRYDAAAYDAPNPSNARPTAI
jgi:DNA-binding transcriptional LysR family regulator